MTRTSFLVVALAMVAAACSGSEFGPTTTTAPATTATAAATTTTTSSTTTTTTSTTTTTPAPPTTTTSTTTTTTPPIDWDFADSAPEVTLFDPGDEPREVRTYDLEPGAMDATSMRFALSVLQVLDGEVTLDVDISVVIEMTVEVRDVLAEGYVLASRFERYTVTASDPTTWATLDDAYAGLSGAEFLQLMSPDGRSLAVAVDDEVAAALAFFDVTAWVTNAALPLPAEPIGEGAVWEVVAEVESQGITFLQTTTVTLVGVAGPELTLETEGIQELGPEGLPFPLPGFDPDTANIDLGSTSLGTAVWDLTRPVPVSVGNDLEQVFSVMVTAVGQELVLDQSTTASLRIPATTASGPPVGVETFEVDEFEHVVGDVTYEQVPPVGGVHDPVWQNCGFYAEPVRKENAVHSLEHGAVWITYRPDLAPAEVETLRDLADRPYTLVSPYPDLDDPVVASAWGVQLRLDSAFDPRLEQFVDWYADGPQTPEPGAPCSGGAGDPE